LKSLLLMMITGLPHPHGEPHGLYHPPIGRFHDHGFQNGSKKGQFHPHGSQKGLFHPHGLPNPKWKEEEYQGLFHGLPNPNPMPKPELNPQPEFMPMLKP
jgi:hypothetical protein